MAFLLPQRRTPIARSSLNVSPRSVPKISGALEFWLEQRLLTSSSTSLAERRRVIRYREARNRSSFAPKQRGSILDCQRRALRVDRDVFVCAHVLLSS